MNKAALADKVHGVLGGTKADAERAVEAMIDGIVDGLKNGDEVSIAGLGIFEAKMRAARTGRNPRTGESIQSEWYFADRSCHRKECPGKKSCPG